MGTEKTGTDTAGKSYLLPIANSQTIRESNRGGIIGPKTVLNNQYETQYETCLNRAGRPGAGNITTFDGPDEDRSPSTRLRLSGPRMPPRSPPAASRLQFFSSWPLSLTGGDRM